MTAAVDRYNLAKAEWAAVKQARAEGRPEPETPNLDALNARAPLLDPLVEVQQGQAELRTASRSAAAHKAWETRRRKQAEAAAR